MTKYNHAYLITSCRQHSDEIDNKFYSNEELKVGDDIVLDGLVWYVTDVLR